MEVRKRSRVPSPTQTRSLLRTMMTRRREERELKQRRMLNRKTRTRNHSTSIRRGHRLDWMMKETKMPVLRNGALEIRCRQMHISTMGADKQEEDEVVEVDRAETGYGGQTTTTPAATRTRGRGWGGLEACQKLDHG
jgi:hypothetical protein